MLKNNYISGVNLSTKAHVKTNIILNSKKLNKMNNKSVV